MNTYDILTHAAKAVGIIGTYHDKCEYYPEWGIFPERGVDHTDYWNPLESKGNAFDTLIACELSVLQAWNKVEVRKGTRVLWREYVENEHERKTLTCLCITQAAAKIGKSMK